MCYLSVFKVGRPPVNSKCYKENVMKFNLQSRLSDWNLFPSSHAAYTYFYKGTNYWRFDNRKTEAEEGYPRSILKDFMGCVTVPGQDEDTNADEDPSPKPESPKEEEDKEVNVVVTVADNESKVMTLIMVTVPLVLILCILVLVYAILRTLQNKEAPRALVHCKRSLQDWVWRTESTDRASVRHLWRSVAGIKFTLMASRNEDLTQY